MKSKSRTAGVEMKRYYRMGVQKYNVVLRESQDIRMEGVHIVNSPLWSVRLQDCDRVWIHGIFVYSDLERGVNADGIDIVSRSNASISDSTITTADDAICLKTERWPRGDGAAPPAARTTENVTVTDSILSSSSTAMVIGTETQGRIENITISGAQGTARGTSLVQGHAERPVKNLLIQGLRVRMLPEDRPDKRATHAMVMERVDGLKLRDVEVEWDRSPEPGWGSALVLRDIERFDMEGLDATAGSRKAGAKVVQKERVRELRQ